MSARMEKVREALAVGYCIDSDLRDAAVSEVEEWETAKGGWEAANKRLAAELLLVEADLGVSRNRLETLKGHYEALVVTAEAAEAERDRLREALNLALMHLEDPRAIAAVRAALAAPEQT